MTGRRILITGGAGFIGYHLARHLSEEPADEILLVDNLRRGKQDDDLNELLGRSNVQFVCGDLTDAAFFEQIGEGYEEVYHLAAVIGVRNVLEKPHEVLRVNAVATLNLLDWFTQGGGKKLLFSSTSEAYAWTRQFHELPIPTPEDVPLALTDLTNKRSTYAGSKIFGELAVTQYGNRFQKPFVIVRYHNVYGPRMGTDHVIPELFQRARDGENPLVVYSPEHSRAFCYVDDAVRASILAMRRTEADGRTLNIGNDLEEIAIGDLARRLLEKAKIDAPIDPKPAANDPISRRCPDISRARELLQYEPEVDLDAGLERTLAWYSKH